MIILPPNPPYNRRRRGSASYPTPEPSWNVIFKVYGPILGLIGIGLIFALCLPWEWNIWVGWGMVLYGTCGGILAPIILQDLAYAEDKEKRREEK